MRSKFNFSLSLDIFLFSIGFRINDDNEYSNDRTLFNIWLWRVIDIEFFRQWVEPEDRKKHLVVGIKYSKKIYWRCVVGRKLFKNYIK